MMILMMMINGDYVDHDEINNDGAAEAFDDEVDGGNKYLRAFFKLITIPTFLWLFFIIDDYFIYFSTLEEHSLQPINCITASREYSYCLIMTVLTEKGNKDVHDFE